jgi:transposase-like protein
MHSESDGESDDPGRPLELADHREDIMAGARQGMTLEGCARVAGVTRQTLHNWRNEYEDFAADLRQARAKGELQHLNNVNDHGSQFILERSFGYVKTERREVDADHDVSGDVSVVEFLSEADE